MCKIPMKCHCFIFPNVPSLLSPLCPLLLALVHLQPLESVTAGQLANSGKTREGSRDVPHVDGSVFW